MKARFAVALSVLFVAGLFAGGVNPTQIARAAHEFVTETHMYTAPWRATVTVVNRGKTSEHVVSGVVSGSITDTDALPHLTTESTASSGDLPPPPLTTTTTDVTTTAPATTSIATTAPTTTANASDVVAVIAGDIASSSNRDPATAALIDDINPQLVMTAGDNAYDAGTLTEYQNYYGPDWGRFKAKTRPVPGNHEYLTAGASGYFDYFNGPGVATGPAGTRGQGYYSFDIGDWHFVALNTEIAKGVGSAQHTWLLHDLSANTRPCTMAYWHKPRWSHGNYNDDGSQSALYQALYDANAEIIVTGHDHSYQRYQPMNPAGQLDVNRGIRQWVVGTGGRSLSTLTADSRREAGSGNTWGVLKLTFKAGSYDFQFVPIAGSTYTDSGSGTCHV